MGWFQTKRKKTKEYAPNARQYVRKGEFKRLDRDVKRLQTKLDGISSTQDTLLGNLQALNSMGKLILIPVLLSLLSIWFKPVFEQKSNSPAETQPQQTRLAPQRIIKGRDGYFYTVPAQ